MRPNLTILVILAALLVIAGAWHHVEREKADDRLIEATRLARLRIHSEIRLRSALSNANVTENGWIRAVDPHWFTPRPNNSLLSDPDRAWLEVDHGADARMRRPRTLEAGPDDAQWWYNPMNGVVCARVPMHSSMDHIHALHRAVND